MNQSGNGVAFIGSGSATPQVTLSNETLSQIVETSDEWIRTRTGIQRRRLVTPDRTMTDLAIAAAQSALDMANLAATELDLIILATSTADDLFGSASLIQAQIGASRAVAFDLTAACSGFVFGLVTASQFIRTGAYRNVLLIGADVLSRWVDWGDRSSCVLFGDGAGAVVMQATDESDRLLGFELRSDGSMNACLRLAYQGESRTLMDGVTITQGTYGPITIDRKSVV